MNNQQINRFVQRLGTQTSSATIDNFYHKSTLGYYQKRKNLRLYLHQMLERRPKVLLIGEAPGYKGCKLTGVPFSSERLLMEEQYPFGKSLGYRLITEKEKPTSESSATILWQTVWKYDNIPVCWNAYPFHPHLANKQTSNRKPNKEELLEGRYFLKRMIHIFKPKEIVAVGQSAAKSLTLLGINHQPVRHPSYGGKQDFENGIQNLYKKL